MKLFHDIRKNGKLYLRRIFIFRSKNFCVFLHNIRMPDDDRDPHDHPWNFVGAVLWGGYLEMRYTAKGAKRLVRRTTGSIAYRKATDIHRIVKVEDNTWTLIFTGPKINNWGFWKFAKGKYPKFVDFMKYLGIKGKAPEID